MTPETNCLFAPVAARQTRRRTRESIMHLYSDSVSFPHEAAGAFFPCLLQKVTTRRTLPGGSCDGRRLMEASPPPRYSPLPHPGASSDQQVRSQGFNKSCRLSPRSDSVLTSCCCEAATSRPSPGLWGQAGVRRPGA